MTFQMCCYSIPIEIGIQCGPNGKEITRFFGYCGNLRMTRGVGRRLFFYYREIATTLFGDRDKVSQRKWKIR
jgi:hypothetical protein